MSFDSEDVRKAGEIEHLIDVLVEIAQLHALLRHQRPVEDEKIAYACRRNKRSLREIDDDGFHGVEMLGDRAFKDRRGQGVDLSDRINGQFGSFDLCRDFHSLFFLFFRIGIVFFLDYEGNGRGGKDSGHGGDDNEAGVSEGRGGHRAAGLSVSADGAEMLTALVNERMSLLHVNGGVGNIALDRGKGFVPFGENVMFVLIDRKRFDLGGL